MSFEYNFRWLPEPSDYNGSGRLRRSSSELKNCANNRQNTDNAVTTF